MKLSRRKFFRGAAAAAVAVPAAAVAAKLPKEDPTFVARRTVLNGRWDNVINPPHVESADDELRTDVLRAMLKIGKRLANS